jgi:hypothetical protein
MSSNARFPERQKVEHRSQNDRQNARATPNRKTGKAATIKRLAQAASNRHSRCMSPFMADFVAKLLRERDEAAQT